MAIRTAALAAGIVFSLSFPARAQEASTSPTPAAPTEPASAKPEVNLLAEETSATVAPPAAESIGSIGTNETSFGLSLSSLGVEVIWSGYGDVVLSGKEDGSGLTFDLSHFNPIISARIAEVWRTELELELEHAGQDIKVEYAFVEYNPVPQFTIRIGKMLVPLGRFNAELHPSFRWNQVSRPAMFRDVMPAVWSDVGVMAYGTFNPSAKVDFRYDVGVINGLGYQDGYDPTMAKEPFRGMRNNYIDNNADKAVVARIGMRMRVLPGRLLSDVNIGISAYTGAVDPDGAQRFSIANLDLAFQIMRLQVRGELAQNFFGKGPDWFTPLERGAYLEATVNLGRFNVSGRWDHVFANPFLGARKITNAFALGLLYQPRPYVSLRVEVREPFDVDWKRDKVEAAAMVAFSY